MESMSQAQLTASIQAGHGLFKALLAELDAEAMLQPGVVGAWSVKDLVAHIVVHEQRMLSWVAERLGGRVPAAVQPYGLPDDEIAVVNEKIYQENRDRPLSEVLADLDRVHAQVLRLVVEAPTVDLLDARRFALHGGEPLWAAVAANTFEHYEEHGRDIRAWRTRDALPGLTGE